MPRDCRQPDAIFGGMLALLMLFVVLLAQTEVPPPRPPMTRPPLVLPRTDPAPEPRPLPGTVVSGEVVQTIYVGDPLHADLVRDLTPPESNPPERIAAPRPFPTAPADTIPPQNLPTGRE